MIEPTEGRASSPRGSPGITMAKALLALKASFALVVPGGLVLLAIFLVAKAGYRLYLQHRATRPRAAPSPPPPSP